MYTEGQIHIASFPSKLYIMGNMKIRNTKLILMTLSGISQKFENNPLYGIPTLHKDLQQESQTEYLQQLPLPHVIKHSHDMDQFHTRQSTTSWHCLIECDITYGNTSSNAFCLGWHWSAETVLEVSFTMPQCSKKMIMGFSLSIATYQEYKH